MRTAIIGGGIAGLTAAYSLGPDHDFTLFEAAETPGGYARAIEVQQKGKKLHIDMGFMLLNDWSYPLLTELLEQLDVSCQAIPMGFSVGNPETKGHYSTQLQNGHFILENKLRKPQFWGLMNDLKTFKQHARKILAFPGSGRDIPLDSFLQEKGFSQKFRDYFVLPLASLFWPAQRQDLLQISLEFFLKFLDNHGMLSAQDQPQWLGIRGGSTSFIRELTQGFTEKLRLRTTVLKVVRSKEGVHVQLRGEAPQHFDRVIMATPADQTLEILAQPSQAEQDILGSFQYQTEAAILHSDNSFLGKKPSKNAIWHFQLPSAEHKRVAVTANMNLVQEINHPISYCVTRNSAVMPDQAKVLKKAVLHHWIPTLDSLENQLRFNDLNGKNHTYFAGAYWYGGFAEDAIRSAQRVIDSLREHRP